MAIHKRITETKPIKHFDDLSKQISHPDARLFLESFKEKIAYARYFADNYENGKKYYNTPSQTHDIALIFKANAEGSIFIIKSSLDCLANALNKIFNLQISKVYFNENLANKLSGVHQKKIAEIIEDFLSNNDYFFKLRNLITHNTVVSFKFDLELPVAKIKAHFQPIPNCNVPNNLEVGIYVNNMIDRIYTLAESIFLEILSLNLF